MQYQEILRKLMDMSNPRNAEGMARFGLVSKDVLGITKPVLDGMAKEIGKNHELALRLWDSGIYDARVLAALIDDPKNVTEKQMDSWVVCFDNWGVCDNACMNLFDKTPFAYAKAVEWSHRKEEFVKRAGFALMASLAVHDKKAPDARFLKFLPIIKRESRDERNYVKKAVNWALRQMGKRNKRLNKAAIKAAEEIQASARRLEPGDKSRRSRTWIAADALRELRSEAVRKRLKK
jgi:3-methyladenine DNA glycosylase AlkD